MFLKQKDAESEEMELPNAQTASTDVGDGGRVSQCTIGATAYRLRVLRMHNNH